MKEYNYQQMNYLSSLAKDALADFLLSCAPDDETKEQLKVIAVRLCDRGCDIPVIFEKLNTFLDSVQFITNNGKVTDKNAYVHIPDIDKFMQSEHFKKYLALKTLRLQAEEQKYIEQAVYNTDKADEVSKELSMLFEYIGNN